MITLSIGHPQSYMKRFIKLSEHIRSELGPDSTMTASIGSSIYALYKWNPWKIKIRSTKRCRNGLSQRWVKNRKMEKNGKGKHLEQSAIVFMLKRIWRKSIRGWRMMTIQQLKAQLQYISSHHQRRISIWCESFKILISTKTAVAMLKCNNEV